MPAASPTPPNGRFARTRRLLVELGPTAPLLFVSMAGPLVGAVVLAATTTWWRPWFGADAGSVVVFWLGGAVATAGCLLPTHATSLVAGYLFGGALGSVVAWLVVLLAASVSYAVWQRWVGSRAVQALAGSPRALVVHRALLGRGFLRTVWLVALLRLSPLMPFAGTNLLLAALGVRPLPFVLATVLGTTPRAVGVAIVGAELSDLDWRAGGPGWTTWLAIAATLLAVFAVGRIARRALQRETAVAGPSS